MDFILVACFSLWFKVLVIVSVGIDAVRALLVRFVVWVVLVVLLSGGFWVVGYFDFRVVCVVF